ncbi:MAG: ATP-binding protein [Thermoplasmata archaeon]|jgi:deoxyadenosine/deoxycytidine kinase|nr:ATP-binding protein [Thermoplasmata archaeon]
MGFYVVIRGPLEIGKSTLSERLAAEIRGEHVSIDRILACLYWETWTRSR